MNRLSSVVSRFVLRSKYCLAFALLGLSSTIISTPAFAQTTIADAPSYAGFWVKPSESGWGLNLQHQGDNIFAAWYTYDADGKPTWLTMSCKLVGNQCKESIYFIVGRPLSQGLTNIGPIVDNVGVGNLTFNTASSLTFTYTLYGKTKTVSNVTKFNFAPADQVPVCTQTSASRASSTNYTDTWWGGAAASGWGLSLSHQGDNIFVAMYTYSDDTKPAWATGLVTKVAGTTATYRGDFSAPRSGTPFFDINGANATTFPLPKTGTFTLTFTSGEAATLDYDLAVGGAATSSKGRVALSRLAVAAGATTSCGVGGVVTPPANGAANPNIIGAGGEISCGITKNRSAICWGNLSYGNDLSQRAPIPTPIEGTSNISSIALGSAHACALRADGTVACWGAGANGSLGQDGISRYDTLKAAATVPNLGGVMAISAGSGATCAIKTDKSLYCWGLNGNGVIIFPIQGSSVDTPTRINGISEVTAVSVGGLHICALRVDGTVACWGENDSGQLGLGIKDKNVVVPTTVPNLNGVVSLAAGGYHTCAVKNDGTALCWGSNSAGQLGLPSSASSRSPLPVVGADNIKTISAGFQHTCALKRDSTVVCWGSEVGAVGLLGLPPSYAKPTAISGLAGVAELSTGSFSFNNCALKVDGSVACWGNNYHGQLGDGTLENKPSPTPVLGGSIFFR